MFKSTFVGFVSVLVSAFASNAALAGAAVTAGDRQAPPGFIVDFISIGTGINTQAAEFLSAALAAELQEGNLSEFTSVRYGREGERKVCFVLAEKGSAWTLVQELHASGLMDARVGVSGTASCKN